MAVFYTFKFWPLIQKGVLLRSFPDTLRSSENRQICALHPLPRAIGLYEWYWRDYHFAANLSIAGIEITCAGSGYALRVIAYQLN